MTLDRYATHSPSATESPRAFSGKLLQAIRDISPAQGHSDTDRAM